MQYLLFILLFISTLFSTRLLVPEEYATIQSGIDAAAVGDTVLVSNGMYDENLILDKSIVLASYAVYDDLSEWITDDDYIYTGQWIVANSHIANTRIRGYNPNDPDFGSVILISTEQDECIQPEIIGFTIEGGSGTTVIREDDEGEEYSTTLGGGILADVSNPLIHFNQFIDNGSNQLFSGGGMYATTEPEDWGFDNRRNSQPRCEINEIQISNNLYNNNDALYGNTFSNTFYEGEIDMSGSIFDVFDCGNEDSAVSSVWVKVEPEASVDYDGGEGQLCAFSAPDVYVDSNIPQECLDEGCGFPFNPFKTIARALEMIIPSENNPITIHLVSGIYSPETGEGFPINMISNINIEGEDEDNTIIDAQQTGRVIRMESCDNNSISNLTVTGGLVDGNGGGMYLDDSDPTLTHVTIADNTGRYAGGGMYLDDSDPTLTHVTISDNTLDDGYSSGGGMYLFYSNPTLTHVTISDNTLDDGYSYGGGMYLNGSDPTLTYVTISGNTSVEGGGIYLMGGIDDIRVNDGSNPTMTHVTITGNHSNFGGGMYLYYSYPRLTHVTITDNTALEYGGGMYLRNYSIPTLTHVTISDNTALEYGGGIYVNYSSFMLTNSIVWDNSPEPFYIYSNVEDILITYSDLEGGWEGEGNIDADPLFTNPDGGDYTLQAGSPCIDTGDSNLWYQDADGSPSDLGATGGLFAVPNFIDYDFGEIGDISISAQFILYNYRQMPITISSVSFGTASFTTDASFPMTIAPLETGTVNISVNNNVLGSIEDEMVIFSDDLPQGLSVSLSGTGVDGNVLSGNLSGVYPVDTYRILDDLTIAEGDTAYLDAGTQFLFDGGVNFNIYGTLKAIGTESDSIIFDNYDDESWSGFTLDNAADETAFEYVRISGADKTFGGGMYLNSSNPTLTHVTITGNNSFFGGGMHLEVSHPTLTHVTISENIANMGGGGMHLGYSNPTLTHVTISDNTSFQNGGGMTSLSFSNPTLTHVTIAGNTAIEHGGGMFIGDSNPSLTHVIIAGNIANVAGGMYLGASNSTLTHVTIAGNIANMYAGGMYLDISSSAMLTNCIVWDNNLEAIYLSWGSLDPIIAFSDIEGGWEGVGNIVLDPLFTNPENGDYTLTEGSPCIDAGTADIDGDGTDDTTDYVGSAPDMGAYEYNPNDHLSNEQLLPTSYSLSPAYPNPFNPVTNINFSVPNYDRVSISVYDISGRLVATLSNHYYAPGRHSVAWDASEFSSGIYFIKMTANGFTLSQKIMLIK